jgi:L-seryl-tRNA(Ser) seleniumtransferase
MTADIQAQLRRIPSVDAVLVQLKGFPAAEKAGAVIRTTIVREAIEAVRGQVREGKLSADADVAGAAITEAQRRLAEIGEVFYRRVVNAAGIILHTGLGRAPLAKEAMEQVSRELGGYSLLQVDVEGASASCGMDESRNC